MSNHVYKNVEITGTSSVSIEEAVGGAVARAARTIQGMKWFEIVETRGKIENGAVAEWQVTLKIGFMLKE